MTPVVSPYSFTRCAWVFEPVNDQRQPPSLVSIPALSAVGVFCAVSSEEGPWRVERMSHQYAAGDQLVLHCEEPSFRSLMVKLAYPVDPGLTREDIEGATELQANADNTGWLFFHGSNAPNQGHLIDVRKAVMAYFEPQLSAVDLKWKQALSEPATAARLLTKLETLLAYRADVVAAADSAERLLPHGHFVRNPHPETDHVHRALVAALSSVKFKWNADSTRAAKYRTIREEVIAVTRELAKPHTPETLWARRARLAAAKKAADAADAQGGD